MSDTVVNTNMPIGTSEPSTIDNEIRATKEGFAERLNIDHDFTVTASILKTETNGGGKHRQISFIDPGAAEELPEPTAGEAVAGVFDVDGKVQLHFRNEDGTVQVTKAGGLNIEILDDDDMGTLDDEGEPSEPSETGVPSQASVAAFVGAMAAMVPAVTGEGAGYAGEGSVTFPNGLILKHGFKVNSPPSTDVIPVVFATPFPNGAISVFCTLRTTTTVEELLGQYISAPLTVSGFTYYAKEAHHVDGLYWQAWGY